MADPILLFNHIPKTAGSTVRHILWQVYGGERVYMITDPRVFVERTRELQRRFERRERPPAAIVSHLGFGLHRRLPGDARFRCFTFLRDPVERVVSHYHYQIRTGRWNPDEPLEAFLEAEVSRSFNVQVAHLGGVELRRSLDGVRASREQVGDAELQRARENLRAHHCFGLTERFDESLLLLQQAFRWPLPLTLYRRQNVGRRQRPPLPPATRRLVEDSVRLDLQLYEYGLARFEEQLARLEVGGGDVSRFQALNRLAGPVLPAVRGVLRPARRIARRFRP